MKFLDIIYRFYYKNKLKLQYVPYIKRPFYLLGEEHIKIGKGFAAVDGVRLEAWDNFAGEIYTPQIIIGDDVCLNYRTHIGAIGKICIGNGVLTGSDVVIIDHNHGENITVEEMQIPPRKRKLFYKGDIIIGDNVWIGDKAVIMGGVTIGEGAVVGANSVVTKNVPPYSVVAGCPAHIINDVL